MRKGSRRGFWLALLSMALAGSVCQGLADELTAVCDDFVVVTIALLGCVYFLKCCACELCSLRIALSRGLRDLEPRDNTVPHRSP
jgi:hypothetical protein